MRPSYFFIPKSTCAHTRGRTYFLSRLASSDTCANYVPRLSGVVFSNFVSSGEFFFTESGQGLSDRRRRDGTYDEPASLSEKRHAKTLLPRPRRDGGTGAAAAASAVHRSDRRARPREPFDGEFPPCRRETRPSFTTDRAVRYPLYGGRTRRRGEMEISKEKNEFSPRDRVRVRGRGVREGVECVAFTHETFLGTPPRRRVILLMSPGPLERRS